MNKLLITTIISTIVFIILTFTPLFNYIDQLLTHLIGHTLGDNTYIVILIHTLIFGVLIYGFLSLFSNEESIKKIKDIKEKKDDNLEAFDVGGSLTCK